MHVENAMAFEANPFAEAHQNCRPQHQQAPQADADDEPGGEGERRRNDGAADGLSEQHDGRNDGITRHDGP